LLPLCPYFPPSKSAAGKDKVLRGTNTKRNRPSKNLWVSPMMKSTSKSKLSRSSREKHAPNDDSNDSENDSSFQSSNSSDSVSSSDSSSETFDKKLDTVMKEARKLKKKRQAKLKKGKTNGGDLGSSEDSSSSEGKKERRVKVRKVKKPSVRQKAKSKRVKDGDSEPDDGNVRGKTGPRRKARAKEERAKEAKQAEKKKENKKGTKAKFIRVDRLWSTDEHRYVLKKSREHTEAGEYAQYAFNVRRKFNWENKHTDTCLDIMSKPLKAALRHIMGKVKGISLEEDSPSVDPNTIFLFLEDLRAYMGNLRAQSNAEKKKEKAKEIALKARHLKVLIKYLDKDYDETKKSLYPLLESKKITFDLLWALFKSDEIVYTPTYDTLGEPRAFKIEYAYLVSTDTHSNYFDALATDLKQEHSLLKGDYYIIEGRYLEFDGKTFGMGNVQVTVEAFKGPRPISSLRCFPLKRHPDHKKLEKEMIERGKKFAALEGRQYCVQKGIAFYKVFNYPPREPESSD